MATRYIGDAVITIEYVGQTTDGRSEYKGSVRAGDHIWKFDELASGVGRLGDTPKAYDEMAQSAVSFASFYTTDNRDEPDDEDGDTPKWAPPPEVADAISDAVSWAQDESGDYEVRRTAGSLEEARRPRGGWWVHWSNGSENGPFSSRPEVQHYADYWSSQPGPGPKLTFTIDQVEGWDERMGPRPPSREIGEARGRRAGRGMPNENISWRDIQPGSRVELVGHTYVVTLPDGRRASAYWSGHDAVVAQHTLDSMVKAGQRGQRLPLPVPRSRSRPAEPVLGPRAPRRSPRRR